MDAAKAAAKRRKYHARIQRSYAKALRKNPSALAILSGLRRTSDVHELSTLLDGTVAVGHAMQQVDAKKKWPTELDVGGVYAEWHHQWSGEAIVAVGRAMNHRDGTNLQEHEVYGLIAEHLQNIAGEEAYLNGTPNVFHYLGNTDPEEAAALFKGVLAS